jgi:predicted nuclease of predicted toxin-antitoxin system
VKFKLDENLPAELCVELQAAGHQADSVHDEGLTDAADPAILERVKVEGRVLLTMDKGIADVRAYPPASYQGIVLFRPAQTGRAAVLTFVRRHLSSLLQMDLAGHLFVVTDRSIRRR